MIKGIEMLQRYQLTAALLGFTNYLMLVMPSV